MHDARARGRQESSAGKRNDLDPLDDWLGDISDDDWSEDAAELADRRRATPVRQERRAPNRHTERDGVSGSPAQARPAPTTSARRAAVERRRAVAALVILLLIGLGAGAAVLLLRDGAEATVTTGPPTVTAPAPTETDPVATTPATTPTSTTSSEDTPTFTLPEGMKLQRDGVAGESDLTVSTDPELIMELQRALLSAGFEPGTPDGTFGPSTEAAVIAFQEANGLSPDGIVGPETADALNSAVAGG